MRRYTISIVIHGLCLSLLSIIGYLLFQKGLWFCLVLDVLICILIIVSLYKKQIRIISDMRRMINGINFNDLTLYFNPSKNQTPSTILATEMDSAISNFRALIREKEIKHTFDNTLLNVIDSGIFVFNTEEEIIWINQAALNEFKVNSVRKLNELKIINESLPEQLRSLTLRNTEVIKVENGETILQFAVSLSTFYNDGNKLYIISLKNIHSILEKSEVESWQKLIRVLTHEIMNSITPIISISETLTERFNTPLFHEKDSLVTQQALQTIHRRSKGLLDFVENYRKLTRIPTPCLKETSLLAFLKNICRLYPNISIVQEFKGIEDIHMWIDAGQIEQVIINLIKNSIEATTGKENTEIRLQAKLTDSPQLLQITITDNGDGIVPEALDKIFVPFYTTKPSGSGIGLSVCKQIMNLHGGTITVKSSPDSGASFILTFPGIAIIEGG